MEAIPQQRMNVDEFLAWAEGVEGRYELVDGEVFAQASERVAHARIKGNVFVAFRDAITAAALPCLALPDGVAVRINSATVYEPDAQVYCGPELPPDTLLVNPVIVVEVISPSTGRNDALRKLAGYFRLASVAHYLIVDPNKPIVIHHRRGESDVIETRIHTSGAIRLEPPGLTLDLAQIYEATIASGVT